MKFWNITLSLALPLLLAFFLALSLGYSATGFAQAPSLGAATEEKEPLQGLRDEKGGLISAKTNKKFSEANPEDITNENFPDLIESFDYPNADIADVIKAIGELTGKNFIVDPQVRGKITIIAPSQITVAEAYRAFLSALAINGLTVVPSGAFLKIKTARNAQRDSIETYSGEYFPNSDQMITRIIKLKYISADEVNKQLRILPSKDGEMVPYPPTNSIIISDYGANIERVMKIIDQLDVPGFEEKLEVIRIKYAKAKDIEELLTKIINKGEDNSKGVPRFRRRSSKNDDSGGAGTESFSLVVGDDRTNSIIVVGNTAGITKIKKLIAQLDFRLNADDSGGVYVYYVRHGEAEQIANTINGIAENSNKAQESTTKGANVKGGGTQPVQVGASSAAIFGGDVKVTFDKNTNSLIVTASKQDYDVVKNLLDKIDIARDQVFVKVIIMEMQAEANTTYGVDFYTFDKNSNGVGRIGFRSSGLQDLIDPSNDSGGVLGFGSGDELSISVGAPPGQPVTVTSIVGLIKFLKNNTNANILSTPQIMALDNEESTIEVGARVPVGRNAQTTANGVTQNNIDFQDATIKLVMTPFISPDTDAVQMKIDQQVSEIANITVRASELAQSAASTTKRQIKTQIVVNSGDTAVLGGLMQDRVDEEVNKIPLLGDIPLLGWLFKSKQSTKTKQNLVVFITPKIIRSAYDNSDLVTQKINERIDFIQQNMKGQDPHGKYVDAFPRKAKNEAGEGGEEDLPESLEEPAVESF